MNSFWKMIIAALFVAVYASVVTAAEGKGERLKGGDMALQRGGANEAYLKECGSCHLAYQPQLLPKRSWEKIMNTLDKHFDDSATLDETIRKEILAYVVKNSAETSPSKVSQRILSSIGNAEVPLRITDTAYFKRKHREVRAEVFKQKSVGSRSNCGACHTSAEKGDYDEHKVRIPKAED